MRNLYQIREVSTLSFNERVLQEAEDRRNPLMERLKFLGIFSSNMDEFFKVRVASIHRRIELGQRSMARVLEALTATSRELDERFRAAYDAVMSELAGEGIRLLTDRDIQAHEHEPSWRSLADWLREYFRDEVLPSLVPIIIHEDQPFPHLVDGSLYFGVKMWSRIPRHAVMEIPAELPRFVELPTGSIMYIDDVIRFSLDDVFYIFEYDRVEAFEFKISRDAELDIDNDFSEGYVRKMERVLQQRKGGRPVRLVCDAAMPPGLRALLLRRLRIEERDALIPGGRYHNMKDLMRFPNHRPDLASEPLEPAEHPDLLNPRRPMSDVVRDRDVLLTYPYQSFDHVIRLLREAAIDPEVTGIRMTLYRAARWSQVVNALANAARNGKKVFVSIELQARFDERNNIRISEYLSDAGARVGFGVPPMKVHSKLLLIERGEAKIAGLSTGNFNEDTGKLYVDSLLLTCDRRLAAEVARVFEILEPTARARTEAAPVFEHLLVSPFNTRQRIIDLLKREKEKGAEGYVLLKVNHLTDAKTIKAIREAADAGVRMDIVVRTTYAMVPHPNIRAISILDRLLEHQRVYIFGKGADQRVFMSSSDLMERNLDWRIEVAFPVWDRELAGRVLQTMQYQVNDTHKARVLDETQSNRYVNEGKGETGAQMATYQYLKRLAEEAATPRTLDQERTRL